LVKSNFPVRLVGSVPSPEDAKVATGLAGTGAERLLGQGDFLVVAQGQVVRMQAAFVAEDEIGTLVARLREGSRPLLVAATGTDGGSQPGGGLARALNGLRSRIQVVK
jgi:DNA segregation ATPase FtsK/SpoIIIE-like protein